jgi:hypothetical protein
MNRRRLGVLLFATSLGHGHLARSGDASEQSLWPGTMARAWGWAWLRLRWHLSSDATPEAPRS